MHRCIHLHLFDDEFLARMGQGPGGKQMCQTLCIWPVVIESLDREILSIILWECNIHTFCACDVLMRFCMDAGIHTVELTCSLNAVGHAPT